MKPKILEPNTTVKFKQPKRKLEFDQEPESKELLAYLRKWLKENYGPRCKARAALCPNCRMYALYDLLEINLP